MKRIIHLFVFACGYLATFGVSAAQDQPNIFVIFTDDVGISNLSAYHNGVMSSDTPNIDSIAEKGMLLTDYYAQPSCTAGRSAFLTGQLPVRTGLHSVGLPGGPVGLNPDTPTLPEILRELGYTTGQFGKNHLGDRDEFLPTMHGFDEYWGWLYHLNAMEYTEDPDWPKDEAFQKFAPRNVIHATSDGQGGQTIEDDGRLTKERMRTLDDEVNKHTIRFIEQAVKDEKPFFTWYCPSRGHVWTHLSPKYEAMLGQNGWGLQEVVMKDLDDHVGEMLAKIEELGIADNTIIIFTADNGPEIMTWPDGGMTPFHGEKGTTWEGGVRAPFLVQWPAKIPADTVNNGIVDGMDLLPTLVAAAGGPSDLKQQMLKGFKGYKAHLDGYNQMPLLTEGKPSNRKEIYYYERDKLQAVRVGDWKAHFVVQNEGWSGAKEELNAPLLFNLRRDPYERAAEESGMYIKWMGEKMWAFGPAQAAVAQLLATFEEWPPVTSQQEGVDASGLGR
ncbi:arylsulfatase [Vibrio sp. 10N.261.51.F12]|uniref:arylsulfatase n=1 Tax=Vibrio sp. 10N.261.51.F12 TaxID=3229679 RepID=UPI0035503B95